VFAVATIPGGKVSWTGLRSIGVMVGLLGWQGLAVAGGNWRWLVDGSTGQVLGAASAAWQWASAAARVLLS
jgi:hypothetical protein